MWLISILSISAVYSMGWALMGRLSMCFGTPKETGKEAWRKHVKELQSLNHHPAE